MAAKLETERPPERHVIDGVGLRLEAKQALHLALQAAGIPSAAAYQCCGGGKGAWNSGSA